MMATSYRLLLNEEIEKIEKHYGITWRKMREIIENRTLKKLIREKTMIELGGEPICKP